MAQSDGNGGMFGAPDVLLHGEGARPEGLGLDRLALGAVECPEVVETGCDVRMLRSQRRLANAQSPLQEKLGLVEIALRAGTDAEFFKRTRNQNSASPVHLL